MHDVADLDSSLSAIAKAKPDALIVTASPFFAVHRKKIAGFALPRKIPTISFDRQFVVDGLLLSYGPSITESYRRGVRARPQPQDRQGARPDDQPESVGQGVSEISAPPVRAFATGN